MKEIAFFQNPQSKEMKTWSDIISGTFLGYTINYCFVLDNNGKKWKLDFYDCAIYDEDNIPETLEEIIDDIEDSQDIGRKVYDDF